MTPTATIVDVAKLAGVSKSTVSRYLNGMHTKERNAEQIRAAIEQLNYSINAMARGLKTARSMTIGVIISDLTNLFITHIVKYCEHSFHERGYSILVCDSGETPHEERNRIDFLLGKQVDGILIETCDTDAAALRRVVEGGTPLVMLDRTLEGLACDRVVSDNVGGAYEAVKAFIENGHTRIGILSGPDSISTAVERYEGYRKALCGAGIEPDPALCVNGQYRKDEGREAFLQMMDGNQPPTAIFVSNYFMAMGVIEAVYQRGIRIPEDVSLFVFDDLSLSSLPDFSTIVRPKLSSVRQPMEEIARTAANLLLKQIEGTAEAPQLVKLQTEIEFTESILKIN